jgi:hypothetical protein
MLPRSLQIFDSEALMLSGCTIGRKSTYPPKLAHLFGQLRKVLGLESVKDAAGNIIQEAFLADWANLRQRALDTAIRGINKKTDLKHFSRVAGTIETSTGDVVGFSDQDPSLRPIQFGVNPVGAGIPTAHLRRPDSPNSLLFARSQASHAEPLDLVISDTCRRSNGRIKTSHYFSFKRVGEERKPGRCKKLAKR